MNIFPLVPIISPSHTQNPYQQSPKDRLATIQSIRKRKRKRERNTQTCIPTSNRQRQDYHLPRPPPFLFPHHPLGILPLLFSPTYLPTYLPIYPPHFIPMRPRHFDPDFFPTRLALISSHPIHFGIPLPHFVFFFFSFLFFSFSFLVRFRGALHVMYLFAYMLTYTYTHIHTHASALLCDTLLCELIYPSMYPSIHPSIHLVRESYATFSEAICVSDP